MVKTKKFTPRVYFRWSRVLASRDAVTRQLAEATALRFRYQQHLTAGSPRPGRFYTSEQTIRSANRSDPYRGESMTYSQGDAGSGEPTTEWETYGRAMLDAMAEVLTEAPETVHHLLLETADYWLAVGLALATKSPDEAKRLLHLLESEEAERAELERDGAAFAIAALT
jgi:hypothetical protein